LEEEKTNQFIALFRVLHKTCIEFLPSQ